MHAFASLLSVLLVATQPAAADLRPISATVDVRAMDVGTLDDTDLDITYKSLIVRLIGEGFSVSDPAQGADIILAWSPAEGEIRVHASTAGKTAVRAVAWRVGAGEEQRFRLIHETVDLARQMRDFLRTQPASSPRLPPWSPPSQTAVVADLPAPAVAAEDRPRHLRIAAHAGVLWSDSRLGIATELAVARRIAAIDLFVGGAWHQPLELPQALSLWEWAVLAGAELHHGLATSLDLMASLGAGVLSERYRYSASGYSDGGTLWDAMATLRLGVGWHASRRWELGLDGGAWVTLHARDHVTAEGRLWRAPPWRPLATAWVSFRP